MSGWNSDTRASASRASHALVSAEHRMVYKIDQDSLLIAQLRYHY
jgi:Txe/YoeB family toxin of Txe-Axe toxin-antitoxin module